MKYEVYHPDGEGPAPKFATWKEALQAQKTWNQKIPGHKARAMRPEAKKGQASFNYELLIVDCFKRTTRHKFTAKSDQAAKVYAIRNWGHELVGEMKGDSFWLLSREGADFTLPYRSWFRFHVEGPWEVGLDAHYSPWLEGWVLKELLTYMPALFREQKDFKPEGDWPL